MACSFAVLSAAVAGRGARAVPAAAAIVRAKKSQRAWLPPVAPHEPRNADRACGLFSRDSRFLQAPCPSRHGRLTLISTERTLFVGPAGHPRIPLRFRGRVLIRMRRLTTPERGVSSPAREETS